MWAELHILKSRLQQGMWNKAQRGEVLNHAPIGFVRTIAGDFVIDPAERVQTVLRLIFAQFRRCGSVSGLCCREDSNPAVAGLSGR
jgi:hypothetical protein